LVFLDLKEVWAFETTDRSTFVHSTQGKFDLDLSLASVESSLGRAFMRVHRSWLVNLAHVKELERVDDDTKLFVGAGVAEGGMGLHVPVARERAAAIRERLFMNATGLRLRAERTNHVAPFDEPRTTGTRPELDAHGCCPLPSLAVRALRR
jgi:hypothetical protein